MRGLNYSAEYPEWQFQIIISTLALLVQVSLPPMTIPDIEHNQGDGNQNATTRDSAHAHEQWQGYGPQHSLDYRPVLRHLWIVEMQIVKVWPTPITRQRAQTHVPCPLTGSVEMCCRTFCCQFAQNKIKFHIFHFYPKKLHLLTRRHLKYCVIGLGTHFAGRPLLLVHPRQVVGLCIVVAELCVRPVNHLFHLCQGDTISLRTERHNTLLAQSIFQR